MSLNKSTGNMYPWTTHTWNPIRGKCPHECSYCYMNRFPVGELRLDEKCLQDYLGESNTIFVGSSTDMWAEDVPSSWITDVLNYCWKFLDNTYFFQTKNPYRFLKGSINKYFPPRVMLGTTLETNRETSKISKAPRCKDRAAYIALLTPIIISIEPILDFDLDEFVEQLKYIEPKFISIGADSKGHHLPEPSPEKIKELIIELEKFTEVKIKPNLKRLLN